MDPPLTHTQSHMGPLIIVIICMRYIRWFTFHMSHRSEHKAIHMLTNMIFHTSLKILDLIFLGSYDFCNMFSIYLFTCAYISFVFDIFVCLCLINIIVSNNCRNKCTIFIQGLTFKKGLSFTSLNLWCWKWPHSDNKSTSTSID